LDFKCFIYLLLFLNLEKFVALGIPFQVVDIPMNVRKLAIVGLQPTYAPQTNAQYNPH